MAYLFMVKNMAMMSIMNDHETMDEDEHEGEEHDEHEGERIFAMTDSDIFTLQGSLNLGNGLVNKVDYFLTSSDYSLMEQHAEEHGKSITTMKSTKARIMKAKIMMSMKVIAKNQHYSQMMQQNLE